MSRLDLRAPWSRLVFAGVIMCIPAVLSYCKASQEAAAAKEMTRSENEAGYKALVESVHHLELVIAAQQETLHLLSTHAGIEEVDPRTYAIIRGPVMEAGSGSGAASSDIATDKPPESSDLGLGFPHLPASPQAALRIQQAAAAE